MAKKAPRGGQEGGQFAAVLPGGGPQFAELQEVSAKVLQECRLKQAELLSRGRFGESQALAEEMEQLTRDGEALRRLQMQRAQSVAVRCWDQAQRLDDMARPLEVRRLEISAKYELPTFFEEMAKPFAEIQKAQVEDAFRREKIFQGAAEKREISSRLGEERAKREALELQMDEAAKQAARLLEDR